MVGEGTPTPWQNKCPEWPSWGQGWAPAPQVWAELDSKHQYRKGNSWKRQRPWPETGQRPPQLQWDALQRPEHSDVHTVGDRGQQGNEPAKSCELTQVTEQSALGPAPSVMPTPTHHTVRSGKALWGWGPPR